MKRLWILMIGLNMFKIYMKGARCYNSSRKRVILRNSKTDKQTFQHKSQILNSKDEDKILRNHKKQRGRPKGAKNKPKADSFFNTQK